MPPVPVSVGSLRQCRLCGWLCGGRVTNEIGRVSLRPKQLSIWGLSWGLGGRTRGKHVRVGWRRCAKNHAASSLQYGSLQKTILTTTPHIL
eukprot:scaffold4126_cov114-Skeletonema_marinoi.AAC.4